MTNVFLVSSTACSSARSKDVIFGAPVNNRTQCAGSVGKLGPVHPRESCCMGCLIRIYS